ncbi:MAG: YihY/virulence factor BrkB family protein [Bdellovibrionia bacterium]
MSKQQNQSRNKSPNFVKKRLKDTGSLFKDATNNWLSDNATMMSGSIAYSTVFSIAPLLIIAVTIASFAFGEQASRGELHRAIEGLVGTDGATAIQTMIRASAKKPGTGTFATIISTAVLIVGASSAFSQLQQSLNLIWKVEAPRPGHNKIWEFVRQRLLTFGMVLVIGFFLLVSLLLTAALATIGDHLQNLLPGGAGFWMVANSVISFGVVTALFAAIYKILPDAKLRWKDVWVGAAVTALLFTIGKLLIGVYIGHSSIASSYGAMGSLVVFLVWVYYSSSILLFGAEFTRVWTESHRKSVPPADYAKRIAA